MNESILDKSKIIKVAIETIQANTWNPKVANTPEYQKIVKSLKVNGLRDYINVRQLADNQYEVVDGMQRYTAAKELGFKEMYIYNDGEMPDKRAKELTIWYQQQVPFDKIMEAKLATELLIEYNDEASLPYSEKEIEEMKAMSDFDFDEFKDEDADQPLDEEKLILKLSKQELKEALETLSAAHVSREEAFMDLIRYGEVREA